LTQADRAVSVDTSKPGFSWRLLQNQEVPPTTIAEAETALAGLAKDIFGFPLDNFADPNGVGIASGPGTTVGPLVRFEIPTVINLSQLGGELNGAFTPDDQMPGVPGLSEASDEGINGEIITFVELPVGLITMGVTSDDGFRTKAGLINSPATGLFLGESEIASTTTFRFVVQFAGVYGFRSVYFDNTGGGNIEWFTVKAGGTRVLLNDTANGGFKTYRVGVAPASFAVEIGIVSGQIVISWTESGTVLQESTDLKTWIDLPAAVSPYTPAPPGRPTVFFRLKK